LWYPLLSHFLRLPLTKSKVNFGQVAYPNPAGHSQHKIYPKSGRTNFFKTVITTLWSGQNFYLFPPDLAPTDLAGFWLFCDKFAYVKGTTTSEAYLDTFYRLASRDDDSYAICPF